MRSITRLSVVILVGVALAMALGSCWCLIKETDEYAASQIDFDLPYIVSSVARDQVEDVSRVEVVAPRMLLTDTGSVVLVAEHEIDDGSVLQYPSLSEALAEAYATIVAKNAQQKFPQLREFIRGIKAARQLRDGFEARCIETLDKYRSEAWNASLLHQLATLCHRAGLLSIALPLTFKGVEYVFVSRAGQLAAVSTPVESWRYTGAEGDSMEEVLLLRPLVHVSAHDRLVYSVCDPIELPKRETVRALDTWCRKMALPSTPSWETDEQHEGPGEK